MTSQSCPRGRGAVTTLLRLPCRTSLKARPPVTTVRVCATQAPRWVAPGPRPGGQLEPSTCQPTSLPAAPVSDGKRPHEAPIPQGAGSLGAQDPRSPAGPPGPSERRETTSQTPGPAVTQGPLCTVPDTQPSVVMWAHRLTLRRAAPSGPSVTTQAPSQGPSQGPSSFPALAPGEPRIPASPVQSRLHSGLPGSPTLPCSGHLT